MIRSLRATALALVALTLHCSTEQTVIAPEFTWSRMQRQHRYDAFEASRFFADGRTMRAPPEGTVPRERTLGSTAFVSGIDHGMPVARIPRPVTRALVVEGRARFDEVCANCHGVLGDGHSAVAENMQRRRPPSLHEPRLRRAPDGRIFQVISEGYGFMPAHAPYLTVDERWAIVAYVRALQLSRNATVATLPAALRAELERSAP
jgi:mono/diheme cytochrome c family protein